MVAKRLSLGIAHPNPVLDYIEAPSKDELRRILSFIEEKGATGWDELLDAGFEYQHLVWVYNSYIIETIRAMDPTIVIRKGIGDLDEVVEEYYDSIVERISKEFKEYS